MKFLTQLKTEKINEQRWKLLEPFIVQTDDLIIVERGFITDYATIPYPINKILPTDGVYKESAVIHDWLLKEMYNGNTKITRKYASRIFLKSLKYQQISKLKIILLYGGVRALDAYKYVYHKIKG